MQNQIAEVLATLAPVPPVCWPRRHSHRNTTTSCQPEPGAVPGAAHRPNTIIAKCIVTALEVIQPLATHRQNSPNPRWYRMGNFPKKGALATVGLVIWVRGSGKTTIGVALARAPPRRSSKGTNSIHGQCCSAWRKDSAQDDGSPDPG